MEESPEIAGREEVLRIFTRIMRGEMTEEKGLPKISERAKAAELLGKACGLFDRKEEEAAPARLQALPLLEAALREVMARDRLDRPGSP